MEPTTESSVFFFFLFRLFSCVSCISWTDSYCQKIDPLSDTGHNGITSIPTLEDIYLKLIIILLAGFAFFACGGAEPAPERPVSQATSPQQPPNSTDIAAKAAEPTPARAEGEPSNVMEFFAALPDKYFTLEGCDRATDKDCKKARAEYLKTFTEVSDIKNGYFKGGCDGAQSCIEMAIFKRPNGRYLVGVATFAEMINEFHFLDYVGGEWRDSSADVPEFSSKNWYELPRVGTTMAVFEKKIIEKGADYEVTEKGLKLYDLAWNDGRFSKK